MTNFQYLLVANATSKPKGGSSDYYKLTMTLESDRVSDEELGVSVVSMETSDIINTLVDNDFDLGNIIKACRRVSEKANGRGKDANDIRYDLNKIKWFADEIERKLMLKGE